VQKQFRAIFFIAIKCFSGDFYKIPADSKSAMKHNIVEIVLF